MSYLGWSFFAFINMYTLLLAYLETIRKPRISGKLRLFAWLFIIILTGIMGSIIFETIAAGIAFMAILGFMCCCSYDCLEDNISGDGGELPF